MAHVIETADTVPDPRESVADAATEAGAGRAAVVRRFETKGELVRRAFAWEPETLPAAEAT